GFDHVEQIRRVGEIEENDIEWRLLQVGIQRRSIAEEYSQPEFGISFSGCDERPSLERKRKIGRMLHNPRLVDLDGRRARGGQVAYLGAQGLRIRHYEGIGVRSGFFQQGEAG